MYIIALAISPWLEDEQNNCLPSLSSKIVSDYKKQQKYFGIVKVIVNIFYYPQAGVKYLQVKGKFGKVSIKKGHQHFYTV